MEINTTIFETFPIIQTERLLLREIRLEDAQAIFDMRSNGRVNQFIARPSMNNLEASKKLIERTQLAYQNKQGIGWAGVLRGNGKMIGTCGFNSIDYPNLRAEIGGELSVDFWGKHLAFETVQTLAQFGFEKMNLHTIEAKVSPDNRGAIFLLEKLGFQKEAHFRDRIYFNGSFLDMAIYTLINPSH